MKNYLVLLALLVGIIVAVGTLVSPPRSISMAAPVIRAPEFPATGQWLNLPAGVDRLSLASLRGKIVLLDFWTYGCINCMHIIPGLEQLEKRYGRELVVIGVHSAKFTNEDETAHLRHAVQRYGIHHPVYNDKGRIMWDAYAVRAWPTLVLLDPDGRVVEQVAGEGHTDLLDASIQKLARKFRAAGKLRDDPLPALPAVPAQGTLWYPGKVLADERHDLLAVADSGHHRLLLCHLDGRPRATIGTGQPGARDGAWQECSFNNPQGMAYDAAASVLYVADTNNHLIRAVDLKAGTVRTLAGTGRQAAWGSAGGRGRQAALSSPWDLLLHDRHLYIAMAGTHQIWRLGPLTANEPPVAPYAGSGRESRQDGSLRQATFAQPSGLATDGRWLVVADSESSSIRAVGLPGAPAEVRTLAGGDLFDWGLTDGRGLAARFQHPLGVAWLGDTVYIADSYNHVLRTLDVASGEVRTAAWKLQLAEPGGIAATGQRLFLADTNNHRILVADPRQGEWRVLPLTSLRPPATRQEPPAQQGAELIIAASGKSEMVWPLALPSGHHLAPGSPQRLELRVEGSGLTVPARIDGAAFGLPVRIPWRSAAGGRGTLHLHLNLFYCSDKDALCRRFEHRLALPFKVEANATGEIRLPALNVR